MAARTATSCINLPDLGCLLGVIHPCVSPMVCSVYLRDAICPPHVVMLLEPWPAALWVGCASQRAAYGPVQCAVPTPSHHCISLKHDVLLLLLKMKVPPMVPYIPEWVCSTVVMSLNCTS